MLLTGGVHGATMLARDMVASGHTQRSRYLNVLSDAARQLGTMWDHDQTTFLGVHVAAIRIENIIRDTARRITNGGGANGRSAIFACVPGEEHTMGAKMAAELHRSKGWNIQLVIEPTQEELLSILLTSPIEILGLSIGSSTSMSKLYTLVRALMAIRPTLKILVSGSLVATDHRPFARLGVDAYAATLGKAERKLEQMAREIARAN